MKEGYCDITAILDRSGSMHGRINDVIGGFNGFVDDQLKVKGTATLTLVQFDDQYQVDYTEVEIKYAPKLNVNSYVPRGMTAMYDAIGKTIISTGARLNSIPESERPDKVIILIQTDGEENASKEYSSAAIKSMIEEQKSKYSWEFVFIGANIDAKTTALDIGIDIDKAMSYADNSRGFTNAYSSLSTNLSAVRGGTAKTMAFNHSDYASQNKSGV